MGVMSVDLNTTKDLSIVIAGVIALVTFVTGTLEYRRRGRHERAETFVTMRRRFHDSGEFRHILDMLSTDDPRLRDASHQERRNLVGYLEEVGLMVNSGLLKPAVAKFMFGSYVELVTRSEHFWDGLDPDSEHWTVFRRFSRRLESVQESKVTTKELSF